MAVPRSNRRNVRTPARGVRTWRTSARPRRGALWGGCCSTHQLICLLDHFARHVLVPQARSESQVADVEPIAHQVVVGQKLTGPKRKWTQPAAANSIRAKKDSTQGATRRNRGGRSLSLLFRLMTRGDDINRHRAGTSWFARWSASRRCGRNPARGRPFPPLHTGPMPPTQVRRPSSTVGSRK